MLSRAPDLRPARGRAAGSAFTHTSTWAALITLDGGEHPVTVPDQAVAPARVAVTVTAVVVTYFPTPDFDEVLRTAAQQADAVVVVSNDPDPGVAERLEHLVSDLTAPRGGPGTGRVRLVLNRRNRGLSVALNQGIVLAQELGTDLVLLLDQDSLLRPGAIRELLRARSRLLSQSPIGALTCANDELVDFVGFPFAALDKVSRLRASPGRRSPRQIEVPGAVEQPTLINSGTLLDVLTVRQVGPLNEALFLDAIDFDYSFRLRSHGLRLFRIESARLAHRQGSPYPVSVLGHRVRLRTYSPIRSFHIVHDTARLVRSWLGAFPLDVLGIAIHTVIRVGGSLLFLPQRRERARLVLRALSARASPE